MKTKIASIVLGIALLTITPSLAQPTTTSSTPPTPGGLTSTKAEPETVSDYRASNFGKIFRPEREQTDSSARPHGRSRHDEPEKPVPLIRVDGFEFHPKN